MAYYDIGDEGTMNFRDGSKSEMFVSHIDTFPALGGEPSIWFEYKADEKNRPLTHHMKADGFVLPEHMALGSFSLGKRAKPEPEKDDFEKSLEQYIKDNFNPEDRREARRLFERHVECSGREYVQKKYLDQNNAKST